MLLGLLVLPAAIAQAQAGPPLEENDPLGAALAEEELGDAGGDEATSFPDPFEPVNRWMFRLNRVVERVAIDPVTRVYAKVFPEAVRLAVRRMFANLDLPATVANDLLQMEWHDASVSSARFLINSTIGVGGALDAAVHLGLPPHRSDFGQTLALAGVGSGPYLVLPLLGPTCLRDALGDVVDLAFRPALYVLAPGQQLLYGGGYGLSAWEAHGPELEALRRTSIDPYAALRNAVFQNRRAEIWRGRARHRERSCARSPCGR